GKSAASVKSMAVTASSQRHSAWRTDVIHLEHGIILAEDVNLLMVNSNSSEQPAWQRNPVFEFFASLKLAVVLLAVLIVAAVAGTIYESSFDAKVARAYVYGAPWFNLWLILLGANLAV